MSSQGRHIIAFDITTICIIFLIVSDAQICVSQLRDIENKIKKGLNMTNFEDIRYTDYALEVSGGSILSVRDTKTFDSNSYLSSYFNFLPFCQFHNNPRLVIQVKILVNLYSIRIDLTSSELIR